MKPVHFILSILFLLTISNFNPQERLGLKIAFWDENVNRYPEPYLSQIKVINGIIYYYQVNPKDQSLGKPYTETLEEAFSKCSLPAPN